MELNCTSRNIAQQQQQTLHTECNATVALRVAVKIAQCNSTFQKSWLNQDKFVPKVRKPELLEKHDCCFGEIVEGANVTAAKDGRVFTKW